MYTIQEDKQMVKILNDTYDKLLAALKNLPSVDNPGRHEIANSHINNTGGM